MGKGKEEMILKIHRVTSGPYFLDEENCYYNICLVEHEDGTMEEDEVLMDDFDSAYEMIKHLSRTIEPIVIEYNEGLN